MEKIKNIFASKAFRVIKKVFFVILAIYIIAVVFRTIEMFQEDKIQAEVDRIHNTRLQLSDVMGENLPPDPGEEADKTVAGIDANKNGIRDDVELAIFEKYPNSAKTRAVLLQYALALQTEMSLNILSEETATAAVEFKESNALSCIWSIFSRVDMQKFNEDTEQTENFVKKLQFNTETRNAYMNEFNKKIRSYSFSSDGCDVDLSKL